MERGFDEKKLRRVHRRFFISPSRIKEENQGLVAELDKYTAHHIRSVLRLGEGAKISLFDGSGKEYLAEMVLSKPDRVKAKIFQVNHPQTESRLELILAQAILKEQAFDSVLSSATELGVKKIIPLLTQRVVVRIVAREMDKKLFRWEKILQESSALSGRVKVPKIDYPIELNKLVEQNFAGGKVILWEKAPGGEFFSLEENSELIKQNGIILVSGPEGGFEDQEAERAIRAGFVPLGLGRRILRAGTAPLTALALIQSRFGDLSQKP